jgi:hypothetical protein
VKWKGEQGAQFHVCLAIHIPASARNLSDRRFKPNSRTVRGHTFRTSAPRGHLLISLGETPTPCKHGLVLLSLLGQVVHQLPTHRVLFLRWPESHNQMTRLMILAHSKGERKGSETLTRGTIARERTKIHARLRLHAISVEVKKSRPCQFLTSLSC